MYALGVFRQELPRALAPYFLCPPSAGCLSVEARPERADKRRRIGIADCGADLADGELRAPQQLGGDLELGDLNEQAHSRALGGETTPQDTFVNREKTRDIRS